MHFVTGGAFNGKREWTIKSYNLKGTHHTWLSAYDEKDILDKILDSDLFQPITVIEGLEEIVRAILDSDQNPLIVWEGLLESWSTWEREFPGRKMVLIGTDITKGIVPVEALQRKWRDDCGKCYQWTMEQCEKANVIWYGISTSLKG
jgi:adenosylcobinamide kinase / adenosylcobinamide-phosphate guanylyltransferase